MQWQPYFKLGIIHYMLYPKSMEGEVDLLSTIEEIALDPYFSVVEIAPVMDETQAKQIHKLAEATALRIIYSAQLLILREKLNLASLDKSVRLRSINRLKEAVDQAYAMEASNFVLMDGYHSNPPDNQSSQAKSHLIESLHEICAYAQSQGGMGVNLETYDRNIEKRCILGPTELAVEVLQQIKSDHCCLGLTLDLTHLALLGEDYDQALTKAMPILTHLHLGNCIRKKGTQLYGDTHPRFSVLDSDNDVHVLTRILRTLLEIGFVRKYNPDPPVISFEACSLYNEHPRWVIAHCKRMLDRAWSML